MKVTKYLPILAVCLMTTGCNSKKEAVLTSGIDLANLDTTAMPGTSFYQYACGGWVKDHPLTDEYSRFGTFDMLRENSREQLKALIAELAAKKDNAPGSAAQKVGDLYNIAMDSVKLNQEGIAPIKAELAAIDAGAEDFDYDNDKAIVYTASDNLKQLQDALTERSFPCESANLVYLPKTWLKISDPEMGKKLFNLMEALDEHDDVNNIYPNFELDDAVMNQLEEND